MVDRPKHPMTTNEFTVDLSKSVFIMYICCCSSSYYSGCFHFSAVLCQSNLIRCLSMASFVIVTFSGDYHIYIIISIFDSGFMRSKIKFTKGGVHIKTSLKSSHLDGVLIFSNFNYICIKIPGLSRPVIFDIFHLITTCFKQHYYRLFHGTFDE